MKLYNAIYLADFLGKANDVCFLAALISLLVAIYAGITIAFMNEKNQHEKYAYNKALYFFQKSLIGLTISVALFVLLPSKNFIYFMVGTQYLESSEIPQKIKNILILKMDEYEKQLIGKDK